MSSITTQHIDELIDIFGGHITNKISGDISTEFLNTLEDSIGNKYELNTNITTRYKLLDAAMTRESRLNNMCNNQIYSFEINQSHCDPVSNQNATGTCWLYSTLNILRKPFIDKYNLKTFEFSVQYLYFWHKYELTNFWLESIISHINLPINSRLIQYLLFKGCEDGSQFDSAVNLIEKYGVIPAVCNNNQLLCESNEAKVKKRSYGMNKILNKKLREYALILRRKYQQNKQKNKNIIFELRKIKKSQMNEIYRILVIHFGPVIKKFNWKYNDKKNNKFKCINNITPIEFYQKYVKPCYDINNLISLVNDPRNEYYKLLTVNYYGNVINGTRKRIEYINVPIDILKQYTIKMLKDNKSVWFACDVGYFYYEQFGSLDDKQFDFNILFGIDNENKKQFINMNKKNNLEYGASVNSHSMVFVGFDEKNINKNDDNINDKKEDNDDICNNINKWKVENSWGQKKGNKGYVMMSDSWFDKYMYQVLIEKDKLTKNILNVLETEPISLHRWDPFAQ